MKSHAYVFTKSAYEFWCYPRDYAKWLLVKCCEGAKNPQQLCIYRDGHLLYYIYVRKLSQESDMIGLCFVFNDAMFKNTLMLFPEFRYVFDCMAYGGKLIKLDNSGELRFTHDLIKNKIADEVLEILNERIKHLKQFIRPLPAIDYSVFDGSWHYLSLNLPDGEMMDALAKFPFLMMSNFYESSESRSISNSNFNHIKKRICSDIVKLFSLKAFIYVLSIVGGSIVLVICFMVFLCISARMVDYVF